MQKMEQPKTYCYEYPRAAITTDCVIFGYDGQNLKALLIQRGNDPYKGHWAFPGGFLNMNETLEEGARRELMEETSFCPDVLEQFHAFSKVDRDPRERVITVAFYALVKPGEVKSGDDASDAQWFNTHEMPPLAFDHDEIFTLALKHLRERIYFEPIGFNLLGETFTLPQLQRIYETILDTTFDRRNFQRKMLMNDLLIPAEEPMMTQRCITELFDACTTVQEAPEDVTLCCAAPPKPARATEKHEVGRKPKWFRFNFEKYWQLKKDNDNKVEF